MRLLLIAKEISSVDQIKNFSGVWAYYLVREFRRNRIEISFDAPLHGSDLPAEQVVRHYSELDLTGIDHVIALGNRYFTRVDPRCVSVLKSRMAGAVTQIHDSPVSDAGVDCTFTLCKGKSSGKSCLVGWAADPEICFPQQEDRTLGILIDHPDYVQGRGDLSNDIVRSAEAMVSSQIWRKRFDAVKIWRIADGGIFEHRGGAVETFHRKAIPFVEACKFYGKAHLFLATHPESVGLTVLETAMAGALPVVPRGYLRGDRLATIRHIKYSGDLPWEQALQKIDITASRNKAVMNSWSGVASEILNWFERW